MDNTGWCMDDNYYKQICSVDNLLEAWKVVKEKGSSGGIDHVSVGEFDQHIMENITQLHQELTDNKYLPEPYKHIEIKKNETETRPLGLLTVRDKIVQTAVKLIIETEIDKGFYHCSYAYRKSKNTLMAIHKVKNLIRNDQKTWLAVCDIDNFFDSISHDLLLKKLSIKINSPATVELIRCWLKMGNVDNAGAWTESKTGVPQGAILSPLLSNFYLHPFDGLMIKQNIGYVRYADDFVMLTNKKADAQKALETAKWFLTQKLLLTLNDNPSVINVNEGFEFLGITFKGNQVAVSQERKKGLLASVEKSFSIHQNGKINTEFFTVIQNIRNYYGKILPQPILEEIDESYLTILHQKLTSALNQKYISSKKAMMDILIDVRFFSHRCSENRFEVYKSIVSSVYNPAQPPATIFPLAKNIQKTETENPQKADQASDAKPNADHPQNAFPPSATDVKPPSQKALNTTTQPTDRPPIQPMPGNDAEAKVARKRREYQKLESAGMELVISNPGIFAGISQNRIVLKKDGRIIHSVQQKNLRNITLISDGIALSSNLIRFCSENNIAIHFLNHNGTPYAQFIAPAFAKAKTGIAQLDSLNSSIAFTFIKASILGKIKNQMNLLKYYYKYRKNIDPDFKLQFDAKIETMVKLQNQLATNQTTDLVLYRQQVFAIEGQTAAIYWSLIKTLLADDVDFPGRLHQEATDVVNMLLNYGYGILYSRVWQALMNAGLNPYISYLHSSERNQPGLVFDFIEEFRQQAVDRAVIALITKGEEYTMKDGQLLFKTRKRVAEKVLERLNNLETFRGKQRRLSDIVQLQAENLCSLINGKIKIYKPYIAKW